MGRSSFWLRLAAALLGGVSCLALAGVHHQAVSSTADQVRQAIAAVPGASARSVDVDLLGGRVRLGGVALEAAGRRISIGRIDVPLQSGADFSLIPEAFAQSGGVTADDIRIELDKTVFTIPHLTAEGSALSGADLKGIFDAAQPGTLEDRLAKLSARMLSAPELTIAPADPEVAAKQGVLTVRNIVLTDVTAGKIKSLSADGASVAGGTAPETKATFDIGKMAAASLDVPLMVKIIQGSRTEPDAPLSPVYDSFSIASIKFVETAPDPQTFEFGAIEGSGLRARPLLVPFSEFSARLDKAKEGTASEDERARNTELTIDALKSVSIGHLGLHDIAFGESGKEKPISFTCSTISLDANDVLRIGSFVVDKVAVSSPDVVMSVARFALEGVDQSGLPDLLKQNGALLEPGADLSHIQALAPKLSTIALSGMHVEAPAKTEDGNSADGNQYVFDIPVVEFKVGGYTGNMASDATSRIEVIYDVAKTAPNDGLRSLAKAGFGHLDVTAETAIKWNADKHEFKFDRLAFVAKDLADAAVDRNDVECLVRTCSAMTKRPERRRSSRSRSMPWRSGSPTTASSRRHCRSWPLRPI